jgi:hypothetical protein
MFTSEIHVKPYVKHFLIYHCGHPVNLDVFNNLKNDFLILLSRQSKRYNSSYQKKKNNERSESDKLSKIEIIIKSDHFYRYGWSLSLTDEIVFAKTLELYVKDWMRKEVMLNYAFSGNMKNSINDFIDKYGFNNCWTYETIKKDLQRNVETKSFDDVRLNFTNSLKSLIKSNLNINKINLCQ